MKPLYWIISSLVVAASAIQCSLPLDIWICCNMPCLNLFKTIPNKSLVCFPCVVPPLFAQLGELNCIFFKIGFPQKETAALQQKKRQPGDSNHDQTWSPNVGEVMFTTFKRVTFTHHPKKGHKLAELPGSNILSIWKMNPILRRTCVH